MSKWKRFFDGIGASITGLFTLVALYIIVDASFYHKDFLVFSDGVLFTFLFLIMLGMTIFFVWPGRSDS